MSGGFRRLAALIVGRPRVVVAATLVFIVAGVALALPVKHNLLGIGYQVPGSESAVAADAIERATGYTETDLLVVGAQDVTFDDPAFAEAFDAAIAAVRETDDEVLVLPPGQPGGGEVSQDGFVATATLALKGDVGDRQQLAADLQEAVDAAVGPGFEAGVTGNSPVLRDLVKTEEVDILKAEAVGLPIALVLLLLAFGTVVSALLPLMLAYGGILASIGIVAALMLFQDFNAFAETFLVMFGLALGIDYSLLFVRRFREERARGGTDREVIERTLRTAGRTVLFSGTIFSAALIPVVPTMLPFFYDSVIAVIVVVVVEVVLLLTLLPIVLLKLGDRLDRGRLPGRFGAGRLADRSPLWGRWARRVMRRPVPFLAVGVLVLGAAAVPLLDVRTGIDLNVRAMEGKESVKPIAELRDHFPNAQIAPVEVLARGQADTVRAAMADAGLTDIQTTDVGAGQTLLFGVPTTEIDSIDGFAQIGDLRERLDGTGALVTGVTAETVDYAAETERYQPWVIAAALLLSFLLLMTLFRSPVLAAKAIVLNLLSIGAALGLTVLLFQEGLAEGVLGFESPGYLQSWTPLTLFIMLFGLSMDYEVFMVSRIREEYDRTGDTRAAVAAGLERTGSVVTFAALIMMAVFGSFMLSSIPEMKQLGFGLAVAVLIDATIVRAVLVPAFMRLAGDWNWWMPAWLDRVLPRIRHSAAAEAEAPREAAPR